MHSEFLKFLINFLTLYILLPGLGHSLHNRPENKILY